MLVLFPFLWRDFFNLFPLLLSKASERSSSPFLQSFEAAIFFGRLRIILKFFLDTLLPKCSFHLLMMPVYHCVGMHATYPEPGGSLQRSGKHVEDVAGLSVLRSALCLCNRFCKMLFFFLQKF